jgi:hypothetical protein
MFRNLHMVAAADLRLFGLLLFFVIFVAVLVRSFVLRRREDFVPLSRLPLCQDDPPKEHAP